MSEAKRMASLLGGTWPKDGKCIFGCGAEGLSGIGGCRSCLDARKESRTRDANEGAERDVTAWRAFRDAYRKCRGDDERAELERRFLKHCPHYDGLLRRWVAHERTGGGGKKTSY